MSAHSEPNKRPPSTTIGWKPVTITSAPQGTPYARRRRSSRPFLARREWRRPLTITVAYRGTSEAWVEIKARGRVWTFDGHLTLLDVLVTIWDADEAGHPE